MFRVNKTKYNYYIIKVIENVSDNEKRQGKKNIVSANSSFNLLYIHIIKEPCCFFLVTWPDNYTM